MLTSLSRSLFSLCVHFVFTFFDIHNDVALMEPIYLKICNFNEHASTISFFILFIKCVASVVRNILSVGKDKGINKNIYLTRNIIRNGKWRRSASERMNEWPKKKNEEITYQNNLTANKGLIY